ncbi:MAG: tyrosine-type recombinase/integrase [Victivallales bacterium]|jgi:integrase/recombinase XerD|nr:tyrosine-type recombinase/integrase [Victivallales bacterium]
MDLTDFFTVDGCVARYREPPLGALLDRFCDWLSAQGFRRESVRWHVGRIGHLNRYLAGVGVADSTGLDASVIELFLSRHRPGLRCCCGTGSVHAGMRRATARFSQFLVATGRPGFLPCGRDVGAPVPEHFIRWLRDCQGCAAGTLRLRRQCLAKSLGWLGSDAARERLGALTGGEIRGFFLEYCRNRGRASRCSMQSTLRTFLRFCFLQRWMVRDLAPAVPTLRTYRLSGLPRGIGDAEARRLLASIERSTAVGKRDYAMIQLLYSYGVRGGQVRALRLDDIDWRGQRIRFAAAKHGKPVEQPLLGHVGEALLDYLRAGRQDTCHAEVFLTSRAPIGPLAHTTALSAVVERRMRAAVVSAPSCGTHAFRHCFVSRVINGGGSIKAVADMIGHRSLSTTFIYAKVDFAGLRRVPLDWPGKEVVP